MYGWLRKTFGRKATKTAGKEVSQEVAQEVGILGAGLGGVGKGVTSELFDSPLMLGVGLLMVGGIFYVVFK